ncbi:hypothetical protein LC55x_3854 [Lysobacter capsici]|nr:hypothetical protein LC55x_3854 [Lysobacter capsici]
MSAGSADPIVQLLERSMRQRAIAGPIHSRRPRAQPPSTTRYPQSAVPIQRSAHGTARLT